MDDDRLASELERRSRAASPRPDWAQRDLLSAVSQEIDARPQPVVTSRWSPRLGLAAVVAALLIMVVAVPRLTPQPPSATSSNAGTSERAAQPSPLPGTMSATEFADEFAAGTIDGKTVLVNGRIDPGPPIPRPWCGPEVGGLTGCYLGQLAGVWPPIEVAAHWIATDAGDQISPDLPWERWHFPSTPLDGVLLLSVAPSGRVEFLGLVKESDRSVVWSVSDADALDIDAIGIDEAVLVRGWLVETEAPGTTRNSLCVRPEFPAVDGLPTRYCVPQDYLSSEQPIDEVGAPRGAARLSVQRHAAQLFGARIQDGTSLFAIAPRLYGGGCAGEPPCWLWDVVARVDLDTSAAPSPTPAPTSSPSSRQIECGLASLQVIDATGLVQGCTGAQTPAANELPVTVSNPDGDQSRLEITWAGCNGPDGLTFKATVTGYELVALNSRPINVICDALVFETRVLLEMSQPTAVETVTVTYERGPSASLGPAPSPSPIAAIRCSGSGVSTSIVNPRDLVLSCTQISPDEVPDVEPGGITVSNTVGDPTRVRIRWTTSLCTQVAWLTLMEPTDRAMFLISPSAPCTLSASRRLAVELVLSRPVEVRAFRLTTLPGT